VSTIRIRRLTLTELALPFRVSFRHASAERTVGASVWVDAESESGARGVGEGCPRPYVTGETLATARSFFERAERRVETIDANPAAWCALELAILDLLARESGRTIESALSLPSLEGRFNYTAVLGDSSPETFEAIADEYRRRGFSDLKIKLSGMLERDRQKMSVLAAWGDPPPRIRVDANNLWRNVDEATSFLRALGAPLFGVEEPLGAEDYDGLARVGTELGCRIVLDESLRRSDQIALLPSPAGRWLINVRVSKMGGLLRSLDVVAAAGRAGIPVIVGAQVGETSVLTRAGLTVAQAARDLLVAQEGAFGTLLLEHDVCDPPLMFGRGGVLDVASHPMLERWGLGVDVPTPAPAR
jgi:L-Ala-D/L-Glu epimerase